MNRELIVKLLHKDIRELEMITSGFMEMNVYPTAIIQLAQQKTEDIQLYLEQLSAGDIGASEGIENKLNHTEFPKEKVVESIIEEVEITEDEDDIEDETIEEEEELDEIIEETHENVIIPTEKKSESYFDKTSKTLDDSTFGISTKKTEITEPEIVSVENKKTILAEKNIVQSPTRNTVLSQADNSISSVMANKKITDIKQAINIGDRFRFQRELFKGNGEDMNKTFTYINLLATQEEALSFLKSKYGWSTDNETAEDFLQIVKRRFL